MIRRSIVVIAAVLGLALYSALLGSLEPGAALEYVMGDTSTSVDMLVYLQRFAASALLLGMLPFAVALCAKVPMRDLGLARPVQYGGYKWFGLYVLAGLVFGMVGFLDPVLSSFYPYYPGLASAVANRGPSVFLLHAGLYLILYYVPWELTFRGVMVVTVTRPFLTESGKLVPTIMLVALLQTAPSAILHFGHPISEILSAVLFGIVAGYLTVVSRSILPALVVHATAGITLDLLVVLRG